MQLFIVNLYMYYWFFQCHANGGYVMHIHSLSFRGHAPVFDPLVPHVVDMR